MGAPRALDTSLCERESGVVDLWSLVAQALRLVHPCAEKMQKYGSRSENLALEDSQKSELVRMTHCKDLL